MTVSFIYSKRKSTYLFVESRNLVNQRDINLAGGGGLKSGHIFEQIISLENLFLAWKEFRRGKAKKFDVQEFEFSLENNLFQLHEQLVRRTYKHGPYSSFYVSDPKIRHIHKAEVVDRVLQHAVFRVLCPIFDKAFIFDSYSCRLGKGTHQAVKQLKEFADRSNYYNRRAAHVLKCDIKKFFDSVNLKILTGLIKRKVKDSSALWLIQEIIESFQIADGVGLPIGNITSQLFANIYLNELDRFIKHTLKISCYIRYCDDFVILGAALGDLEIVAGKIKQFLNVELGLSLHSDKIVIRRYFQGIDFLGYVVRPYCTTLRTKTKKRAMRRIDFENQASYFGILKHCCGFKIKQKMLEKLRLGKVENGLNSDSV